MPNPENITSPFLIVGAGRTASSYFLEVLRLRGDTHTLIENTMAMDLRTLVLNSWWSREWHWVCTEDELEERLLKLVRLSMCTLFPSEMKYWSYKAIWESIDWDWYERVYPDAKYIHLVRDPRTNIQSMMDFMGGDGGQKHWTLEYASRKYIDSNLRALELAERGVPYLLIRQEDFVDAPQATWERIFDFLGLPFMDLNFTVEINVSSKTKGKVAQKRNDNALEWGNLPQNAVRLGQKLGYSVPMEILADDPASDQELKVSTPDQPKYTIYDLRREYSRLVSEREKLKNDIIELDKKIKSLNHQLDASTKSEEDLAGKVNQLDKMLKVSRFFEEKLARILRRE